jgi:glycosyltransferase involved in cell wall biosynthesis
LIINQVDTDQYLKSDYKNVKVLNSKEKGLSKSRNLAIKNASKKIALIADDDVVFIESFEEKIIYSYNENPRFSVICFQTLTKSGKPYSKYSKFKNAMKYSDFNKVLSIEVTFLLEDIKNNNCSYNELFGLGAKFEDAETLFFLRRIKYTGLNLLFCPISIVIHESFSSSDEVNSDRLIYAKMAGFYKRYGGFAYFYLLKYLFFLIRKRYVSFHQIKSKLNVGIKAFDDYKGMVTSKVESKYE